MCLHYWVNPTQVEPGFTLGNFFCSVDRALGESHGTKFGSFFHTSCYQNQMDNVCAGKCSTF